MIDFIVYDGAIPGSLTIEMRPSADFSPAGGTLRAPLNQIIIDGDPKNLFTKAWGTGWATPMTSKLLGLGGDLQRQLIRFDAPSLDLTDNGWYGTGDIDATTDPVIVSGVPTGTSIYGRQFNVGDYILWDDPTSTSGLYSYEIDKVIAASGATLKLQRTPQGAPPGQAHFGSPKRAHTAQNFFQLIPHTFYDLWGGEFQVFKHLWDRMTVCAVTAQTLGQDPVTINLATIPPVAASPGLAVGP